MEVFSLSSVRRRAFRVVDDFELALSEFTSAPFVISTDSCSNAVFLGLSYERIRVGASVGSFGEHVPIPLYIPKHTYVGVVQAARNAGFGVVWSNEEWVGSFKLKPTRVVDSARRFERNMFEPGLLMCVSFQAAKRLPVGRGGAVLTDDEDAAKWIRRARLDGRVEGADYMSGSFQRFGAHMYMTPPDAARGLWLLTYLEDEDSCSWEEYPDLSLAEWVA